jgi:putative membrane protein
MLGAPRPAASNPLEETPGVPTPHQRHLLVLAGLFTLWWAVLAVHPYDRSDWMLENVLVAALAVVMALSYRHFVLSRISYTLIFVFACLHEVGAHYTYAEVPYEVWWHALTGGSFNALVGWQRNNFDRVVHFSYGLLLAYPIREVFLRVADVRGFWGYFLPLDLTMSTSMLYELGEWFAAEHFGGGLGMAYLGTQGDVWDAHKDMAMASLGALAAMTLTALINRAIQRDFAREWSRSLAVKEARPLGEDAIARLWRGHKGHPDPGAPDPPDDPPGR